VIRREFDIGEGDAYNKVLIDRTERRLNNLGYFKSVRITNEPGSAPDRVIVNVNVEDQSTGQFSIAGGYSTTEGFIGEVGIRESNLLGTGRVASVKGSTGQYTRGIEFNYTEPYVFDRRMSAGFDIYNKQSDNARFARYSNMMTGGTIRLAAPVTEEFSVSGRYSLFTQDISIPNDGNQLFNDCSSFAYSSGVISVPCFANGEASLAIKDAQGNRLTSMVGYTLTYNTLDNVRDPRSGLFTEFKQDFAGLGGDSTYIRSSIDSKYYYEFNDSFVAMVRGQAGYIYGVDYINDNFFMGSNLVRGFANGGIGPRDITIPDPAYYNRTPLGGSTYFGTSAELQFPVFGLPREAGLRGAVFADAGSLFGYDGPKSVDIGGVTPVPLNVSDDKTIRTSAGVGVLWASPLGPIRLDFAWPITKGEYDQTQMFRFSGGTSF
jgi:outer membrane protein insertion porin family